MSAFKKIKNNVMSVGLAMLIAGCNSNVTTLDKVLELEINKKNHVINDSIDVAKYGCSVGAHRGNSVNHLENTIDAIKSAKEDKKYSFIEFDVQYTKDNKIVAYHDGSLFRLYGKFGKIENLNYKELQEKTNNNIANYNEVMDIIGCGKSNIEIKSQGNLEKDKKLVDYIVKDISKRKINDDVMISSISDDVVKYVKEKYPKIKTGQVFWINASTYVPFDFLTNNLYKKINETGADYLMLHVSNLHNLEDLIKLKPKDKTVVFWNFDDKMYLVHKDPTDKLWGTSSIGNTIKYYGHSTKHFVTNSVSKLFGK